MPENKPRKARTTAKPCLPGIETFELTRQLPHLLRRAHFAAENDFPAVFGAELTSRQLALLVTVAGRPGISQTALGAAIGIDQNTCSDLIARTEARHWIRRTTSPHDARVRQLSLTAAGKRVVGSALPYTNAYEGRVAARLTQDERRTLVDLLRRLLGFEQAESS